MAALPYDARTDNVSEKLRLFEAAYAAGNYDLAMSLTESIKDTLQFERWEKADLSPAQIGAEQFAPVAKLPRAWTDWARGWSFCKPVVLFETVGIERRGEPVDIAVGFRADQTTDLPREVRVVRLDEGPSMLREVPCQVYDETRRGLERRCRLVFFVDVPAHGEATYLVFYGNPYAECLGRLAFWNYAPMPLAPAGLGILWNQHVVLLRVKRLVWGKHLINEPSPARRAAIQCAAILFILACSMLRVDWGTVSLHGPARWTAWPQWTAGALDMGGIEVRDFPLDAHRYDPSGTEKLNRF